MADHENDNTFQISVKGLVFDKEGKVLMTRDDKDTWEPFGGRIQKGEDMIEALVRECKEETGLDCRVLDERPLIVYASIDDKGRGRLMVYYRAQLDSLDFTPSDECREMRFFAKDEIQDLPKLPQIVPLINYL